MARAIETRRRIPPESSSGNLSIVVPARQTQRFAHSLFRFLVPDTLFLQLVSNILAYGERIEKRAFLKYKADFAAEREQFRFTHRAKIVAPHPHMALRCLQQSCSHLQNQRLACAGLAN